MSFLVPFWLNFGCILSLGGCPETPWSPFASHLCPRTFQNAISGSFWQPLGTPFGTQGLPKGAQVGPRGSQGGVRVVPRAPQGVPRGPQGSPQVPRPLPGELPGRGLGTYFWGSPKKTPKFGKVGSKTSPSRVKNSKNTRVWHRDPLKKKSGK